jgi:hypothetical protein
LSRLKGLGGANLGDRTMVDVIEPTVIKLQSDPVKIKIKILF